MEESVLCAGRLVRERFDCLTDAYRCLQSGSCPCRGAADVVAVIFSEVCGVGERASAGLCCGSSTELTYISMSLVEKITSTLTSQSLSPAVELYFSEILRMLFQDMDLMSHLVHRFQSEDQIISHLAAKSVSTGVLYHLTKSNAVSPVWEQKCAEAFHRSPPGAELDACLWSLTEVLRRLLKGAHQEILGKLLASLDSSLCALCSKFLPEEGNDSVQCAMDRTCSAHWGTTFCLLLDLLEVLTASSLVCGAGVRVKSPSLIHIHSSGLLTIVSCSSAESFVKKRALLLLKRAVLQRAGEDWSLEVLFTGPKSDHFNWDMARLAQSVLTAVAANWLQSVQVDSDSFFGGTANVREDGGREPSGVMLRAVSLLLLKSTELHIQTTGGAATEVYGHLRSLLGFLKRHSVQLMELTHLCSWVSLLFGEQDDDMMEAAKSLLSIFLSQRKYPGSDDFAVLEASCSSGCNPHCHFLLLLQSVSFDHAILLDFLISAETCFLEYFVRYLKYLRADWHGFRTACGRIGASGSPVSRHKSLTTSYAGHMFTATHKDEADGVKFSCCVQPTCAVSPLDMVSLAPGLRLVEYDSSEESDLESMNEGGTSVSEISELSALNVKQTSGAAAAPIGSYESSDSTGFLSDYALGRRPEGASPPALQSPNMAALSEHVTCHTSARALGCLSELRAAVTRLQSKKLFPYNPSSLLKLLALCGNCSQQSHLSHVD